MFEIIYVCTCIHCTCSDHVGLVAHSRVVEKNGSNLKIHFIGWPTKWDCYIDCEKEFYRFAQAYSVSNRPAHRFKNIKKGDFIDVNPIGRHPGWRVGQVTKLHPKSGQAQVVYEYNELNYLYWGHLDNEQVFASFTSKTDIITGDDFIRQGKYLNMIAMENKNSNKNKNRNNNSNYDYDYHRIRNQKFPKYSNELIDNKYNIGNKIDVLDIVTQQWKHCVVIDKENNWIVVHYDGESSRKNEKLHVKRSQNRLRVRLELQKKNGDINDSNNNNNNQSKNKNKLNENKNECRICFDNTINTVCTPCGHASMCRKCSNDYIKQNSECPICRKKFDNVFDFFIA